MHRSLMLLCKFTGIEGKRTNGDPRTDDYALKKKKKIDPTDKRLWLGVYMRGSRNFSGREGVYPPYPTNRIGQISDKEVRGIS